jgi:CSLREA domain-containing protein
MPTKGIVAVASILAAFAFAAPVHAAGTFTVNTTADTNFQDAFLSLREAIMASNGSIMGTWSAEEQAQMSGCFFIGGNIFGGCGDGVRDTIVVPAGTYAVGFSGAGEGVGDFDITEDATIQGAGSATTIVDGSDLDRVFELGALADDVAISGLTIRNGQTTAVGGGIYVNGGGLTLSSSVVRESTSPNGGGIFNGGGDLFLVGSSVTDNNVGSTTAAGGGIYNEGGGSQLTLSAGSVVSGNDAQRGGGILNGASTMISHSQVTGNDAVQHGGGILNSNGTLTLTNSLVQGNNANDTGGGISNQEATLTIVGSSVIGNTAAPGGGGISVVDANATLTNTTISGNSTNSVGGGLLVEELMGTSTVTMNNVTITGNTADADAPTGGGNGGGFSNDAGDVTLRNTIVAGNADRSQSGAVHPDCSGSSFVSGGHNLIETAAGCIFTLAAGDLVGQPVRLGPLTELNGTFVHPLESVSPAIDAGDPATCAATDQRGVPRPQNTQCDIGAYEYELPFSLTISNARVKEGDRGRKAMVFLVRLSAPRAQAVSVGFRTRKGTAKPRQDFIGRSGRLTFAPGVTLRRLVIRIKGDRRDERLEKFRVLLASAVGGSIADGIGVGRIRDNDP